MYDRRPATMALLFMTFLCCGGNEETRMPPVAEEIQETQAPAAKNPASSWHSAIEAINVDGDRLGWKGIHIEDTLDALETTLGHELSLEELGAPSCGQFFAHVEYEGMKLDLQFESVEPDAELESIYLPISPYEGEKAELVGRLKSTIPSLVYKPSIYEPDLAENENPTPFYLLPDDLYHAVLLKPAEGIYISISLCF